MIPLALNLPSCTRLSLRSFPRVLPPKIRSITITRTPSGRRTGALPSFPPTSSPELDTILNTLRTNLFLPAALIKPHQKLVFRKSLHKHLLGDVRVVVELGGESHTLRPLDHLKEPPAKATFQKILGMIKEKKDWDVVPPLLEGYKLSGRPIGLGLSCKMIRMAGDATAHGMVNECLRRVEKTDFRLDNADLGREVIVQATVMAIQSGWSEEGLTKAIKFADKILELMEDPRHVQQGKSIKKDQDPRRKPEIVGVMMGLLATRAVKFRDGKDEDGGVERYTEIMMRLWENADFKFDETNWGDANRMLRIWLPTWQALKMEEKVQGRKSNPMRELTDKASQAVQQTIERARDAILANPTKNPTKSGTSDDWLGGRGLSMYTELASTIE